MSAMVKTELINNYINENNLSKTAFCKLCKISLTTLNNILANKGNIRILAIFKISRAMKIKISELLI